MCHSQKLERPQQHKVTGWGTGATLVLAGTYGRSLELLLLSPADARCSAAQLQPLGRLRLDEVCAGLGAAPGPAGSGVAAAGAVVTPVAESALLLPDGGGGGSGSSSGGMQVWPAWHSSGKLPKLSKKTKTSGGPATGPSWGLDSDQCWGPETGTWP